MEKKDKIYFSVVFICLLMVSGLVFYMKGEAGECIKNPYVYGASRMGDIECSCSQYVGGGKFAFFSFNDTVVDMNPESFNTDIRR